jgi:hypothetical protein
MRPATLTATVLLALVSLAQLLRLIWRVEVTAGGSPVPMWVSGVAFVVAGGVALMLWREGRR